MASGLREKGPGGPVPTRIRWGGWFRGLGFWGVREVGAIGAKDQTYYLILYITMRKASEIRVRGRI